VKKKTKKKLQFRSKAAVRSASSYKGALKVLQLLQRSEGTENVSNVIASNEALTLMEYRIGGF
jgi:hypothetical protein